MLDTFSQDQMEICILATSQEDDRHMIFRAATSQLLALSRQFLSIWFLICNPCLNEMKKETVFGSERIKFVVRITE